LWNAADRYLLYTSMAFSKRSSITYDNREVDVNFRSAFQVFLEDRISLTTSAGLSYNQDKFDAGENIGWQWSYRLGITYHIDRKIF